MYTFHLFYDIIFLKVKESDITLNGQYLVHCLTCGRCLIPVSCINEQMN